MARNNPGVHSIKVGEMTVTALNDGQFEGSVDLVVGADKTRVEETLRAAKRVLPPRLTVSCFLLEWGNHRALIDFGGGGAFGHFLGHARSRLDALGVTPDSIEHILMSHGHVDHVGGLTNPDGTAIFPSATLHASGTELDFWTGSAADKISHVERTRAAEAAYRARTRRFDPGQEVIPGITTLDLSGHTPGHSGFMISSGGEQLLIWSDAIHLPGLQFAMPEASVAFDVDPDKARATRLRVLDMARSDGLLVAGFHLDFPLFGHVIARGNGEGYAFEPLVWGPTDAGLPQP